jgi:hypothetical protein
MTDLTMGKVKALYQDMVAIEQNIQAMSRAMKAQLATLVTRAASTRSLRNINSSLKTIVTAAAIAFGLGVSITPGSRVSVLFAGIPLGLGLAWAFVEYLERSKSETTQLDQPTVTVPIRQQITESEFLNACLEARIEGSVKDACEAVIFRGLEIEDATKIAKTFPSVIEGKLKTIYSKINAK